MSPAMTVIKAFGGVNATARALGLRPASVSYWKTRSKGHIPGHNWKYILKAAQRACVTLTLEDLMYGRKGRTK